LSKYFLDKFIIGTAAFGIKYGIGSNYEKVDSNEVHFILETMLKNGINKLDTAQSYGESEYILGTFDKIDNFIINSKSYPLRKSNILSEDIILFQNSFFNSLKLLKKNSFNVFFIHDMIDLNVKNSSLLFEKILELKSSGYINKIGASIYNIDDFITNRFAHLFDFIQMPFNIFDQRYKNNYYMEKLKKLNTNIQIRSIYLQGLFFKFFYDNSFKKNIIHKNFLKLDLLCRDLNISPKIIMLKFIYDHSFFDSVVVGIHEQIQLLELIENINLVEELNIDMNWDDFRINDECIIDPRNWKENRWE